MIEITKPGKTKFIGVCNICGCEFTYGLDDLKWNCFNYIECPNCQNKYFHPSQIDPNINYINSVANATDEVNNFIKIKGKN